MAKVQSNGAIEAVPKTPARSAKTMTVMLVDQKEPVYNFVGTWVGADVRMVTRTIARAYRKQQLAVRRAALGEAAHEASDKNAKNSAKEETNG